MVAKYGYDGVRGLLYGDPSQLVMQLIDAGTVAVFGFAMAFVWVKVSDLITPLRASPASPSSKASTSRRGAPTPTPTSPCTPPWCTELPRARWPPKQQSGEGR